MQCGAVLFLPQKAKGCQHDMENNIGARGVTVGFFAGVRGVMPRAWKAIVY